MSRVLGLKFPAQSNLESCRSTEQRGGLEPRSVEEGKGGQSVSVDSKAWGPPRGWPQCWAPVGAGGPCRALEASRPEEIRLDTQAPGARAPGRWNHRRRARGQPEIWTLRANCLFSRMKARASLLLWVHLRSLDDKPSFFGTS